MGNFKWNFSNIDIVMTAFVKSYIVKKANIDMFFLSKYGSWVRFLNWKSFRKSNNTYKKKSWGWPEKWGVLKCWYICVWILVFIKIFKESCPWIPQSWLKTWSISHYDKRFFGPRMYCILCFPTDTKCHSNKGTMKRETQD